MRRFLEIYKEEQKRLKQKRAFKNFRKQLLRIENGIVKFEKKYL